MAILRGFPPSNTVTSYGFHTMCSGTYSDYSEDISPREFDRRHFAKPNEDYDEFFQNADQHIASRRITKEVPPVEEKFRKAATEEIWSRPAGEAMNGYMANPEAYCKLKQQTLIKDSLSKISGLTPDLLTLHDAIFVEGEQVQEVEMAMPVHKKFWWDQDSIEEEFKKKPGLWSSLADKVAYYSKNRKDNDEPDNG